MDTLERLKTLIPVEMNLQDMLPADFGADTPLFGEGLGLDSLDAVELMILIQKHFGLEIKDLDDAKPAFKSLGTLAAYIDQRKAAV